MKYLIFILFLSLGFTICSQSSRPIETPSDSSKTKKSSVTTIFSGQPGRAMAYSLVLPGAGQLYNKRWWKVPFALAIEGAGIYNLKNNLDQFNRYDTCYKSYLDGSPDVISCGNISDQNTAFRIRQSARSNKELAWIFMGGAHLLVAVEAFIDRHLINFDTSDKLSFHPPIYYPEDNTIPLFGLQINLNQRSQKDVFLSH